MQEVPTASDSPGNFARAKRPFSALFACMRFLGNINNTSQFFRITDAIDSAQNERNFQRYLANPIGARLNAEGVNFADVLADRAHLEKQPEGSLAAAYLAFLSGENLDMHMLMDAERAAGAATINVDPARRNFIASGIALHDVLHVVTGYGRDPVGEACLLAFTAEQFSLKGVGAAGLAIGCREQLRYPGRPIMKMLTEATDIARGAIWVPEIDWRNFLGKPLEASQRALGLRPPDLYQKYWNGSVCDNQRESYVATQEAA